LRGFGFLQPPLLIAVVAVSGDSIGLLTPLCVSH
jgi:hypothetical protein